MNAAWARASYLHVQRLVVLVLLFLAFEAHADVSKMPSATQWKRAEATLRAELATLKITPIDITRKAASTSTLGTAFWIREQVGTKIEGRLAIVRGTVVYATKSDATLRALLAADAFLRTRAIAPRDFLYLVEQLAGLPAGPGNIITEHKDRGLLPAFSFGKTAKDPTTFVIYSFRQTTTGSPAHRTQPLTRATLTIAPDYALSWAIASIDRPTN